MNFISFFKAIWDKRQFTIPILALLVGAAGGYHFKKCPVCAPAVVKDTSEKKDTDKKQNVQVTKDFGSKDVIVRKYAPPPASCPNVPLDSRLLEEVVIKQEPTKITTNSQTLTHSDESKVEHLKTTPVQMVTLPRLSAAWLPQVKPDFNVGQIQVGVRLTDHLWAKGAVQPPQDGQPWKYYVGAEWTFW